MLTQENPCDIILSVIANHNGCQFRDIQSEFPLSDAVLLYHLRKMVKQGRILRFGKKESHYGYCLPINEVLVTGSNRKVRDSNRKVIAEKDFCDMILSVIENHNGCQFKDIQNETSLTDYYLRPNLNLLIRQGKILRLGVRWKFSKYFLSETLPSLKKCAHCGKVIVRTPILKNIYFPDEVYCSTDCVQNTIFLSIDDLEQVSERIGELKQSGIKELIYPTIHVPKLFEFIEYLRSEKKYIKQTIWIMKSGIHLFFKFLFKQNLKDISVSLITRAEVLAFLRKGSEKGLSPNTLSMKLFAINQYFKFHLIKGWIERNPIESSSAIIGQIESRLK